MALQVVALAALAVEPPVQDFCSLLDAKDSEVVWNAPTNQTPRSVKLFRVVPREFSAATVSNLLQISGLKSTQRKRVDQGGVFAGKDVRFFADRQEIRQLNLIPSEGFVVISHIGVEAKIPKEIPEGVPSPETALQLTLEILQKIGINRSELATNANGKVSATYSEAEVIHKDKASGQIMTKVVKREIYLTRQIEGLSVWGTSSGVTAHFGNKGQLGYLTVVWRTIKSERDCSVPSAEDFTHRIKSGQAWIPNWAQGRYKKLSVENVHFYYWENAGSEPQTHIYPFAVLEATTDQPGEKSNVQLFVPFAE